MGIARPLWRNGRAMGGEGGQAMVEAAFVLPLTVALILCTIQITQLQQEDHGAAHRRNGLDCIRIVWKASTGTK